jgi:cytochrome c55X
MQWSSKAWRWWRDGLAMGLAVIASQAAAGDADVSAARLSYMVRQDCGSCHGLTLKGGLGSPLTPEMLARWDRDQIVAIILDGIPGTPMPAWRALLSEAEVRWIADSLQQGTLQ